MIAMAGRKTKGDEKCDGNRAWHPRAVGDPCLNREATLISNDAGYKTAKLCLLQEKQNVSKKTAIISWVGQILIFLIFAFTINMDTC